MTFAQVDALRDPFYARYACRDGRPFFVCCVGHKGHIERLLKGLGLWDGLIAEGLPTGDPFESSRDWGPDAQGNTVYAYPLKGRWAHRIRRLLGERFATRTCAEWERFFSEQRIPGLAERSLEEWLACDHAHQSGLVMEVDDPEHGRMVQPGPCFWVRGAGEREPTASAADRKMDDLPSPEGEGGRLPLAGVRILDLSNVIAGPTAAGVLTRFGAECIKVDRPFPELDPGLSVMYSLHCSRGKRSLLLDVRTPDGRDAFRSLVESADVASTTGSTDSCGSWASTSSP